MCDFCTKHGDGGRWYLQAKNYSDDLVSDLGRQRLLRKYARAIFSDAAARVMKKEFDRIERFRSLPGPFRRIAAWYVTRTMKRDHFGQVVPLEDIEKILPMINSIVRLPCLCRRAVRGKERHYCIGISAKPDLGTMGEVVRTGFDEGPDLDSFERLSPAGAIDLMRGWESEGLLHTIWTFGTPFIGGICNCDRRDCLGMVATVGKGVKVLFRAEYVASIDEDRCTGCRSCMRACQFGAIGSSAGEKKAFVDETRCYGCGVCRTACASGAISLAERSSVPAVANLW